MNMNIILVPVLHFHRKTVFHFNHIVAKHSVFCCVYVLVLPEMKYVMFCRDPIEVENGLDWI